MSPIISHESDYHIHCDNRVWLTNSDKLGVARYPFPMGDRGTRLCRICTAVLCNTAL